MAELETTSTNDPQQLRTALALRGQDGRVSALEQQQSSDLVGIELTSAPGTFPHGLGRAGAGAYLVRSSEHCTLLVGEMTDVHIELSVSVAGPVVCTVRAV